MQSVLALGAIKSKKHIKRYNWKKMFFNPKKLEKFLKFYIFVLKIFFKFFYKIKKNFNGISYKI